MSSPNLSIPLIAEAQDLKYLAVNEAIRQLDEATQGSKEHTNTSDVTIALGTFTEYFVHEFKTAASAAFTVTLPASTKRFFGLLNDVGQTITAKIAGSTVSATVESGSTKIFWSDGTDLIEIAGGATGSTSDGYQARLVFDTSAMTDVWRPSFTGVQNPRIEFGRLPAQTTDATYGYTEFTLADENALAPYIGSMLQGGSDAPAFQFHYSGAVGFELPANSITARVIHGVVWIKLTHKADSTKGLSNDLVSYRTEAVYVGYVNTNDTPYIEVPLNLFSGETHLNTTLDGTIGIKIEVGCAFWDLFAGSGTVSDIQEFEHNLRVRHMPEQPASDTTVAASGLSDAQTVKALPAAANRPYRSTSIKASVTNGEVLFIQAPKGVGGGSAGVTVADEGTDLSTVATTLNFVGAGVTAAGSGATKTITIPGGGPGGAGTDYGVQYNRIALPGSWTFVAGALGGVDANGEIGFAAGSPARYKIVTTDATARALIRQWAEPGQRLRVGTGILDLTLADIESPTGTFVLTGTASGTAPSAGAVNVYFDTPFALDKDALVKATKAQAEAGTDDTAYTTPKTTADAIDARAVTPADMANRWLARFAAQDTDTTPSSNLNDGAIGFFATDGTTQHQSGDVAGLGTIYLPKSAAVFGQDASSPVTPLGAYAVSRMGADLLANPGASVIVALTEHGQTATVYFQADLVEAYGTQGYKLSQITHLGGSHTPASYGVSWNVVVARNSWVGVKDILDARTQLVFRSDLEGHETDQFASYDNALFGANYFPGSWCLFTGSTQPTDDTNAVRQPDIASGNYVLVWGDLRSDSNPNAGFTPQALDANQWPSDRVIHVSPWAPFSQAGHLRITLTTAATKVGSGNTERLWARVSVVEVGDLPIGSDYYRWSENHPSTLAIDLPPRSDPERALGQSRRRDHPR